MSVPTINVVDASGTPRVVGVLPDQVAGRTPVEILGGLGVARQIAATSSSGATAVTLTPTCNRISMIAIGARMRFEISETPTASRTASHLINVDERLEFWVPSGSKIAVATDSSDAGSGTLELTELVNPS